MNTRTLTPILLLPLFAVLVIGCGGGGGSSTQSKEALPKAQLLKRGDALCAQSDSEKLKAAGAYIKKHPEALQTKAGVEAMGEAVVIPQLNRELESLRRLAGSGASAAQYKAVLTAFERGIEQAEANPGTTAASLQEANQMADAFGFQVCNEFL